MNDYNQALKDIQKILSSDDIVYSWWEAHMFIKEKLKNNE